jgi:hypothetical protein
MKIQFHRIGDANARIWELEKLLAIPKTAPIMRIKPANERIAELEAMLVKTSSGAVADDRKNSLPKAALAVPPAAAPVSSPPAPTHPPRAKMLAAIASVFPALDNRSVTTRSDGEIWEAITLAAWKAHLKVEDMPTDAEMEAHGFMRPDRIEGGRLLRSMRQERLEKILGVY